MKEKCVHNLLEVKFHEENSYPTLCCPICGATWSDAIRAMHVLYEISKGKIIKIKDK